MLIVTIETIPGRRIVQTIGKIEAMASYFAINEEKSINKRIEMKAKSMGANAIVGYAVTKTSIGVASGIGTAVVIE